MPSSPRPDTVSDSERIVNGSKVHHTGGEREENRSWRQRNYRTNVETAKGLFSSPLVIKLSSLLHLNPSTSLPDPSQSAA
ncbi:hypothetical protein J6590_016782 [Homalodisca vitripennis]|nr:hypothetical protein J6590_016782 [Homalodisca vitripennis]